MSESKLGKLRDRVQSRKAKADQGCEKFRTAVAAAVSDGALAHDLEWAESAFERAAEQEIFTRILSMVNGPLLQDPARDRADGWDALRAQVFRSTTLLAQSSSSSTSQTSNLMDRYRLAAWAHALEMVREIDEADDD